jgi:serine/threonine protein kinase
MGVVYQAQELSSGRIVALKVLLAEHTLSQEAFDRFQREARIAASISDSRCVFVYGAHQVDGAPAIAMELVAGETLEHKLARGEKIPIQTAVRWTIDILDGLEAAAMAGVVHRDVKPSNCFVSADGHVKVGDFGLARSFEADLRLTLTGQFLGSPLYASPEQIKGREVDQRSDLYSCGATLYAMLTGHAPHSGSNIGEVLARILSEEPPRPRAGRPEIPRGLERVVLKAMERDPRKRFQTHADMRAELQSFVVGGTTPAHPMRRGIAYLIDMVVLGLADLLLMAASNQLNLAPTSQGFRFEPLSASTLLLPLVYFSFLEAWQGLTLGKWLAGLRIVADGRACPGCGSSCAR